MHTPHPPAQIMYFIKKNNNHKIMIDSFLHNRNQKKTRAQLENLYKTFLRCKNLVSLALLTFVGAGDVGGQTILLSENIGTSTAGTTSISSSTFQNGSPISFSGTADTRTSTASTSYSGSSGGRNVFITNTVGRDFIISGINTTGYSSITLSFGHYKSTTASNNELAVEVSTDGTNWNALSYSRVTGSAIWELITPTGTIPATSNLRIRFRQTSTSPQFRVDDIKLVGTATLTAPTAPTITTITPGNGQLSVAFTAPTSNGGAAITNYAYSIDNGVSYTPLPTPSTTSPIVISGLTNNTTYDVKVRAINSVGSGAESNMVQGTPTNAATVPILTTPTVSNITPTSATLGATITSDGGSSISSRGTVFANTATPRGNLATEGGTAVGAFSHSRTGLSPNRLYYFAGFASNTPGTAYSSDGTFTTLHNAPTIGAGSGATTTAITANWTAPAGGGSASFTYEVALSTSSTFASTLQTQSNIASNTTNHTFTGLSEGTTYYFRVRAVNAGGNSAWSTISPGYATLNNAILLTALGTAATENFDGLANSGTSSTMPMGWYFIETGSSANSTYTAGTGSSSSGDTYSFGSGSDRALGGLLSGSVIPTIGAKLTNNTGAAIHNLFISYTGETWRVGSANRSDQLDFQYSLDATSLSTGTWIDVNTLDYANPGQATGSGSMQHSANITDVISGLNIANGASFWIRWTDFNAFGSDDGMAIDDISIKPCGTVSAPTASAAQSFCAGATIANLAATGSGIQWYAASSGGVSLSSSTALADNTTYYVSQTISGCESVNRTAVAVTFKATHTWVGGSAGDWNTVSNWCGGVPNSTSASVTIPSGTTVTLNTNASVAQLTIASGGTLTVSGTSQLTVASGGTFTNNGTFTAGTGTLIFAGSGTIAGSASIFHHLTLNGALTRSATTTVNGILTMNPNASLSAALSFGTSVSLVYNVSAAYTVTDNEWPASNGPLNVTIQHNSTLLTLNNSKIINGTLTLTSGKVILGSNSLTANAFSGGSSSSFVITDGSGRLQTNVSTTAITFPIGPDASNYNPVTITNNTGTPDDFAVLVFEEVTEDGTRNGTRRVSPNRVNLTWDINKLTNASANAGNGVDFAFSWSNSQLKGSIASSRFRLYHHSSLSWNLQSRTPSVSQNAGVTTLVYTEYKGTFSPFAIGDDVQLLPVVWEDVFLQYDKEKKVVLINWSTVSETNSDFYVVEKSETTVKWEELDIQKAAGFSYSPRSYISKDFNPTYGNTFYRIKQVDLNGEVNYSKIASLFLGETEQLSFPHIFPNPVCSNLIIHFPGLTQIKYSLLSSIGQVVIPDSYLKLNGSNEFVLDLQNISEGVYFLKIETIFGIRLIKVVKE